MQTHNWPASGVNEHITHAPLNSSPITINALPVTYSIWLAHQQDLSIPLAVIDAYLPNMNAHILLSQAIMISSCTHR
jgi:hypothetical protein